MWLHICIPLCIIHSSLWDGTRMHTIIQNANRKFLFVKDGWVAFPMQKLLFYRFSQYIIFFDNWVLQAPERHWTKSRFLSRQGYFGKNLMIAWEAEQESDMKKTDGKLHCVNRWKRFLLSAGHEEAIFQLISVSWKTNHCQGNLVLDLFPFIS